MPTFKQGLNAPSSRYARWWGTSKCLYRNTISVSTGIPPVPPTRTHPFVPKKASSRTIGRPAFKVQPPVPFGVSKRMKNEHRTHMKPPRIQMADIPDKSRCHGVESLFRYCSLISIGWLASTSTANTEKQIPHKKPGIRLMLKVGKVCKFDKRLLLSNLKTTENPVPKL